MNDVDKKCRVYCVLCLILGIVGAVTGIIIIGVLFSILSVACAIAAVQTYSDDLQKGKLIFGCAFSVIGLLIGIPMLLSIFKSDAITKSVATQISDNTSSTVIAESNNDNTDNSDNQSVEESKVNNDLQDTTINMEQEFKSSCVEYTYTDIMRDPTGFKNKNCVLEGSVNQIIEGWFGSNSIFIMDNTGNQWGCVYSYKDGEKHLLEGDYVRVYGVLDGTRTTETVLGKQVVLPYLTIKYISLGSMDGYTATDISSGIEDSDFSSDMTTSQRNALKSARNYLKFTAFSRDRLIEQLSSDYGDNYSIEDAEFVVSYLEQNNQVDWNEQAYKAAKTYMEYTGFSRDGLYEQLAGEYGDKFTPEQAEYALSKVGY